MGDCSHHKTERILTLSLYELSFGPKQEGVVIVSGVLMKPAHLFYVGWFFLDFWW